MNETKHREGMWRQFGGDDWACVDALPPAIRERIQEHAYDAWSATALMLRRIFRRRRARSARAERSLLRYLGHREPLGLAEFASLHRREYGMPLPHQPARAAVLQCAAMEAALLSKLQIPYEVAVPRALLGRVVATICAKAPYRGHGPLMRSRVADA